MTRHVAAVNKKAPLRNTMRASLARRRVAAAWHVPSAFFLGTRGQDFTAKPRGMSTCMSPSNWRWITAPVTECKSTKSIPSLGLHSMDPLRRTCSRRRTTQMRRLPTDAKSIATPMVERASIFTTSSTKQVPRKPHLAEDDMWNMRSLPSCRRNHSKVCLEGERGTSKAGPLEKRASSCKYSK